MVQKATTKAIDHMEAKKERAQEPRRLNAGNKVVEFVGEVKQELKKVEWTSKEELRAYTKIVLAGTFLLGAFIYLIDLIIQGVLYGMHFIVKAIVG